MDDIYLLYAFLCGGSIYVALLCFLGKRAPGQRVALVLGYAGLAVAFLFLTLGRAQALGIRHGQFAHFTRLAFGIYGVSLVVIIGSYWVAAWRAWSAGKQKGQE